MQGKIIQKIMLKKQIIIKFKENKTDFYKKIMEANLAIIMS